MVRHIHQEFLFDILDDSFNPEAFRRMGPILEEVRDWKVPRDLFDWPGPFIRSASLSEWEEIVAEPEDLKRILSGLSGLDRLVLLDDRPKSENPNIAAFSRRHLYAFLWHCHNAGIPCEWTPTHFK